MRSTTAPILPEPDAGAELVRAMNVGRRPSLYRQLGGVNPIVAGNKAVSENEVRVERLDYQSHRKHLWRGYLHNRELSA